MRRSSPVSLDATLPNTCRHIFVEAIRSVAKLLSHAKNEIF